MPFHPRTRRPARPHLPVRRPWALPTALALAVACLTLPTALAASLATGFGGGPIGVPAGTFWVSSPTDDARRLLQVEATTGATGTPVSQVAVDPTARHQTWWGTGAALTDASLDLIADRPGALRKLYSPRAATGARLDMLRLPLSATDFSPKLWAWDWKRGKATPPARARAAAVYVADRVLRLRPDLRVVGAAWSAPAPMKDSGTLRGGNLADRKVKAYGRLLVAQAAWLKAHDVPLWATTLGNEPGHSSDYPTMRMTDEQMARLADAVGPELRRLHTRLWAVDHNWSDRARYDAALAAAPAAYHAAAFHCYGGAPSQMGGLPVPGIVTECTGTDDGWAGTFAWDARNLVTEAVAAGSSGLILWNLALDDQGGPVDTGSLWGCKTCRGLLSVTPTGVAREPEFYTLAHLTRAATPGARVITTTPTVGVRVAGFRNPDGSIGIFGHNATGSTRTIQIQVPGAPDVSYPVGAGELFTYRQAS